MVTGIMTTSPLSAACTRATGQPPVIYYGTELPARSRARRLRDTSVVLQPYHPLCQTGGFADYFPHARRFVYFNPTAVQAGLLATPQVRAAIVGYDPAWDLERLDLRSAAARRFAAAQGRAALRVEGVHGLFVDDLDRWDHPGDRPHAHAVLRAVMAGRPRPAAWFVNRGFGFWEGLPGLAAGLLEELSPYRLDHMGPGELSWVSSVVLGALRHAQARGADIHCLTYDPADLGWQPRGDAARAVAAAAGHPLLARRLLDRWPHMLT